MKVRRVFGRLVQPWQRPVGESAPKGVCFDDECRNFRSGLRMVPAFSLSDTRKHNQHERTQQTRLVAACKVEAAHG